MKAGLVRLHRRHGAQPAHDLDADRDAEQRGRTIGMVALAGGQHGRHDDGAGMHRPAFERVVEILAMGGGAVDERGASGAHRCARGRSRCRSRRRPRPPALLGRSPRCARSRRDRPRRSADPRTCCAQRAAGWGIERRHFLRQDFGDGNLRKFGVHADSRIAQAHAAEAGDAVDGHDHREGDDEHGECRAPKWRRGRPNSLRSKISTEITLVSEVNSMMAADSSRITPTKMKHQVAITLVRRSGAVMSRSARSRVAPRMRLASSRSVCTERNADCIC